MIAIRIQIEIANPPADYQAQSELAEQMKQALADILADYQLGKVEASVLQYIESETAHG